MLMGTATRRQMLRLRDVWARSIAWKQKSFSTSQWLPAEGDEKPTMRQKSQAMVGEMASVLKEKRDHEPQKALEHSASTLSRTNNLNVTMIPEGGIRSLGRRGRFSGLRAPGGMSANNARSRRGWRKGKNGEGEGEGEGEETSKRQPDSDGMTVEERILDRRLRFGETAVYKPSLSMSDLELFVPAEPSSAAGRQAIVLENLCILARGNSVGVGANLGRHFDARMFLTHGMRYFADLKDRNAAERYLRSRRAKRNRRSARPRASRSRRRRRGRTAFATSGTNPQGEQQGQNEADATTGGQETAAKGEGAGAGAAETQGEAAAGRPSFVPSAESFQKAIMSCATQDEAAAKRDERPRCRPIMQPADVSIRQVIVDRAIVGNYEKPVFAIDAAGIARSWHLRSGTYGSKDVESFERKLLSLLGPETMGSGGSQPTAR
ncbi:hypothetical protein L249_0260 [Ophiocordyceps polyrhachis-furcata BCC 54312]|uniref:Uncharacterized protein n=1 Tax=Ophiocordyceps polyrhachis-furcata BCC 54312 TaxID=1330021 RepID=A0A367LDF4_9HYPO|nr:hypothetical protein L249_0260 [Ophiocordyceps polyrhachis-furcata BCC 54312]